MGLPMKFRTVKSLLPVIGIDDGIFTPRTRDCVPIIGCVMKGASHIEGFLHTVVQVDTAHLTEQLLKMLQSSKHIKQIRTIFTHGITFAGFGILDAEYLSKQLSIPVITILDHYPDYESIKRALLTHFPDGQERWKIVEKTARPIPLNAEKTFWYHCSGIDPPTALKIIRICQKTGHFPEALRIAHMVGTLFKDWQFKNTCY